MSVESDDDDVLQLYWYRSIPLDDFHQYNAAPIDVISASKNDCNGESTTDFDGFSVELLDNHVDEDIKDLPVDDHCIEALKRLRNLKVKNTFCAESASVISNIQQQESPSRSLNYVEDLIDRKRFVFVNCIYDENTLVIKTSLASTVKDTFKEICERFEAENVLIKRDFVYYLLNGKKEDPESTFRQLGFEKWQSCSLEIFSNYRSESKNSESIGLETISSQIEKISVKFRFDKSASVSANLAVNTLFSTIARSMAVQFELGDPSGIKFKFDGISIPHSSRISDNDIEDDDQVDTYIPDHCKGHVKEDTRLDLLAEDIIKETNFDISQQNVTTKENMKISKKISKELQGNTSTLPTKSKRKKTAPRISSKRSTKNSKRSLTDTTRKRDSFTIDLSNDVAVINLASEDLAFHPGKNCVSIQNNRPISISSNSFSDFSAAVLYSDASDEEWSLEMFSSYETDSIGSRDDERSDMFHIWSSAPFQKVGTTHSDKRKKCSRRRSESKRITTTIGQIPSSHINGSKKSARTTRRPTPSTKKKSRSTE